MRIHPSAILLLLSSALVPMPHAAGGDSSLAPVTAAARELSRQMFYFQNTIATIPGPSLGRGLYQQCDGVQTDLIYFQQQLKRNVSREQLLIAFDKMDAKLNTLLSGLKGFEKWDDALRMVARRVQAAQHDLQFALAGGGSASTPQLVYRQTLNLLAKSENFAGMVRYVFDEQNSLPAWNADLKSFSQAIARFQAAQQNKAAMDQVKSELLATEHAWEKLITRLQALPQGQYILVQSDAAQVDQVIFRLAKLTGTKIERAALPDPLAF